MRAFNEEQRFNSPWIVLLLAGTMGLVAFLSFQSYAEIPENGSERTVLVLTNICTLLVLSALFFIKLKTNINEQGISYGFWPFQINLRHIPWHDIANIYVRKYSPIGEYGGWGYRFSFSKNGHGKAYNVSGTIGIQIEFKNGKKTLIGTQKKDDVENVLKTYAYKYKQDEHSY